MRSAWASASAKDEDGSGLSDHELRDQLITLLLAGHETTATGLAWTLEQLVRNPGVLEQATLAARGGDDGFLDALVTESLRVRPVVPDVARRLTKPVELGGHVIPAGAIVAPSVILVHGSSRDHPDPTSFDPSRWVGQHPDPARWLPFGGGNRRCLGAAFATTEMRVVLREVLRRVDLEATDAKAERPRVRHVTLVPHAGARVTVRSRRPAEATLHMA